MRIKETPQGLVIEVKIRPNSGAFCFNNGIAEVRSPAREGKANTELIRELGKIFKTEVRILRGQGSRSKIILLKNLKKDDIRKLTD
jgi:uncharacterized protein (TIGR00251 family)